MRIIGCEGPKQSILVLDSGSLVVQDQLDHHELWRGRWESNPHSKFGNLLNPFVGRSAAFMRPRRRRGSSEKARSRWQFRCIAAPRNQLLVACKRLGGCSL